MQNNTSYQTKWNQARIKSYLLETRINNKLQRAYTNLNVNGIILAFNTKIKYNDNSNKYYLLSLLLYLDLRTARVERYIMNSSDPIMNNKGIDFKEDVFYMWNNKKYKLFHKDKYTNTDLNDKLSALGDGKLTRKFYELFMYELTRDYLIKNISYKDGNMLSLIKLTAPTKHLIPIVQQDSLSNDNNNNDDLQLEKDNEITKSFDLGTGVLNEVEKQAIAQSSNYSLKNFEPFVAKKFWMNECRFYGHRTLYFKDDNHRHRLGIKFVVFVPKQLKNTSVEYHYDNINLTLIYTQRKELPPIVNDLTRTLSMKTVKSPAQIYQRIKTFNYNIEKKLTKWTNEKWTFKPNII